jgi:hypothetical protein
VRVDFFAVLFFAALFFAPLFLRAGLRTDFLAGRFLAAFVLVFLEAVDFDFARFLLDFFFVAIGEVYHRRES